MKLSSLRYYLYRLSKRITLGPLCGGALGSGLCRTLEEGRSAPSVANHIIDYRKIASAYVQQYPFPVFFPPEFPREAAFDSKFVYRLHDVLAAPDTGVVWMPGGPILQESAGSLPRLFKNLVASVLETPQKASLRGPIVLFPTRGYYHSLLETLPNILHSLIVAANAKILLPKSRHRFVDEIVRFLNIDKTNIIESDRPLLVDDLIFSPLWVNSGFIPTCDLSVLRDFILPRIPNSSPVSDRIYVSRSRSRNRPLGRETELERALAERGFTICFFETMTLSEQFAAMHHAKFVIAPHGAGLANLVAAKPGVRVLELLSRNWFNTCYAKLAVQIGCDYRYLETVPHGDGFDVPVEAVLEEISRP